MLKVSDQLSVRIIDAQDCPISRDQLVAVLHGENVLARKYWPVVTP
jgi:hypothetical protein